MELQQYVFFAYFNKTNPPTHFMRRFARCDTVTKRSTPPWVFSRLNCTNGTKSRKAAHSSLLSMLQRKKCTELT